MTGTMETGWSQQPRNSADEIKMRQLQSTLVTVGKGILLFGAWTVVKALGKLLINRADMFAEIKDVLYEQSIYLNNAQIFGILLLVTLAYLSFGIAARSYIGFSAISEGKGRSRRCRILYLLLTALLIVNSISEVISGIRAFVEFFSERADSIDTSVISILIELTSVIMMAELIFTVIRLRKLEKQLKQAESAGQGGTAQQPKE